MGYKKILLPIYMFFRRILTAVYEKSPIICAKNLEHLGAFLDKNPPFYKRNIGNGRDIKIYCNSLRPFQRAKLLLETEPETIRWVDSFDEDSVFWDIGANIGIYSLYASKVKKNIKCFSFEPFSANYFLLNKNIEINRLDKKITAYRLLYQANQNLIFYI